MSKKANKQSKFSRCIRAPIRVLCKVRDFYIQSMTNCAEMVGNDNVMGCPAGQISTVPKSFSVNSSRSSNDEDLRELIRVASTRSLGNKVEADLLKQKQLLQLANPGSNGMPRSFSVVIGRIEEDKPCEFGEDVNVKTDILYPRSRSYAVSKRPGVLS